MANDKAVNPEAVKRRMWIDYQYADKDRTNSLLAILRDIAQVLMDPSRSLRMLMQEAANTIQRKLWIKEVTIGLKDLADGTYKYEVMAGLKESTWSAHRSIAYTIEEFNNPTQYKGKQISRFTKLFLSEDDPYAKNEVQTYDKPIMLQMARRALDDSIEGDYLDINILGSDDELLGWIEISGTVTGKLPDIATIRTIEGMASVLALAITRENERRGAQAR